jgi:hypothetical protein
VIAVFEAMVAVAVLSGGDLGEGPSYLENFFSAGLGCAAWLLLWFVFELMTKSSLSITEERDVASGVRVGGLLVASALILGRATAGNWISVSDTIHDLFGDGWAAGVVFAVAMPVEWLAQPTRVRPFPSWIWCGALPALFYLSFAAAWLWHLGRWEGMPGRIPFWK